MVWWIVLLSVAAVVVAVALVAVRGVSITPPALAPPRPATSREEALARLAALQRLDDATVAEPCATRLFEPSGGADVTVIVWHGLTNCPAQFVPIAERLRDRGFRVLLPRMPRHGRADVLTRDLADITAEELVEHAGECVDIAVGFGGEVWVIGFSAGGVVASWAAAVRPEVRRLALAGLLVAPKAVPMPLVRLMVRFPRAVPRIYYWWDPRKKERLGESPYVYPGFPLPGLVPFLHLGQALYDRSVAATHRLARVVLVTNPGDFAIRQDTARRFVARTFGAHADVVAEVFLARSLGWWHDFVDPWGPHVGGPDQVTEVFLSALGVADDPSAGGALTEPLPPPLSVRDEGGAVA